MMCQALTDGDVVLRGSNIWAICPARQADCLVQDNGTGVQLAACFWKLIGRGDKKVTKFPRNTSESCSRVEFYYNLTRDPHPYRCLPVLDPRITALTRSMLSFSYLYLLVTLPLSWLQTVNRFPGAYSNYAPFVLFLNSVACCLRLRLSEPPRNCGH
ncbi:hypothetical protein J6590_012016 [Homalodisca vitripennis]|nr:hypothetical protein J6590_012016 [Homalodisca vitripennis]